MRLFSRRTAAATPGSPEHYKPVIGGGFEALAVKIHQTLPAEDQSSQTDSSDEDDDLIDLSQIARTSSSDDDSISLEYSDFGEGEEAVLVDGILGALEGNQRRDDDDESFTSMDSLDELFRTNSTTTPTAVLGTPSVSSPVVVHEASVDETRSVEQEVEKEAVEVRVKKVSWDWAIEVKEVPNREVDLAIECINDIASIIMDPQFVRVTTKPEPLPLPLRSPPILKNKSPRNSPEKIPPTSFVLLEPQPKPDPRNAACELCAEDLDGLKQLVMLRQSRHGPSNPFVGQVWIYVAIYHRERSNFVEARDACYRAAFCTEGEHPKVETDHMVGEAFATLGVVQWQTGELEKAATSFEHAVECHELNEELHGRDPNLSLEVADCMQKLSMAHRLLKKGPAAINCLLRCKQIHEKRKSDPSKLGSVLDGMGMVHADSQAYDSALRCHWESFEIKRLAVGMNDPILIPTLLHIGNLYKAVKDNDSALKSFAHIRCIQALALSTKVAGNWEYQLGETCLVIADICVKAGYTPSVSTYCEEALGHFERAGVDDARVEALKNRVLTLK